MYIFGSVVSFLNDLKSKRTVGVGRILGVVFSKDTSSVKPRSCLVRFKWGGTRRPRGGIFLGDFLVKVGIFRFKGAGSMQDFLDATSTPADKSQN